MAGFLGFLRHIRPLGCVRRLHDSDPANALDVAQRRRPVAIEAGYDDSNQLSIPILR